MKAARGEWPVKPEPPFNPATKIRALPRALGVFPRWLRAARAR